EPIRRYTLQFEVRDASTLATIYTDTLSSIVLDNRAVVLALDMEELRSNACNPLGGAAHFAHVLYTVDHAHLNNFSVTISNNGGTVHPAPPMPRGSFMDPAPPPPNFFFRGGNSGPHDTINHPPTGGLQVDISGDSPCAYRVTLAWATREYLTSGTNTEILYCK
ncbi:MAG TPA: hypothetical protein VGR76_21850, partial [Candidatus Angelobacter sp.]|nr:hypothetical protein [Candidatus Angelobacter sp.]